MHGIIVQGISRAEAGVLLNADLKVGHGPLDALGALGNSQLALELRDCSLALWQLKCSLCSFL